MLKFKRKGNKLHKQMMTKKELQALFIKHDIDFVCHALIRISDRLYKIERLLEKQQENEQ